MITKRITSFLDDEILCDLMEFRAILSDTIGLDMMDIQRDLDVEFSENDDNENNSSNDEAEIAFIQIYELIQKRIERVGEESYPFSLTEDGSHFFLKPEITGSGYIYLFCLLLSHPKEDDVLTGIYVPNIGDNQRKLFQSCSTVAAAGLIAGNAVSFGFPRPDGSNFHNKLREVYKLIKDGRIRETSIPGTPENVKDFKVDLIAWLHRQDAEVLERYFLAQVASGKDWTDKALSSDQVDQFHRLFFDIAPSTSPERGMFIPFIFEYERDISLEDKLKIFETIYGKFHYRFSIPRYYAHGCKIAKENKLFHIDGLADLAAIRSWVDTEIKKILESPE
jgi:hypothetical protein